MKFEVIIVDDDKIVLYFQKILIIQGDVHSAPLEFLNGKDTLEYLSGDNDPDKKYLILLDINMPEMNGWEFLEALNQQPFKDQVLVVMVTSSIDKVDREKAFQYRQVIEYVEKPISAQTLNELKNNTSLKTFLT